MSSRKYLAAAAAILALAGCSTAPPAHAHQQPSVTPSAAAPAALSGLELRTALALCAGQIELGTANGHDYTDIPPHSHALPRSCWPLTLPQLGDAARRALADMLRNS